jgi:tetratricopeptide (TPR) repeat protein
MPIISAFGANYLSRSFEVGVSLSNLGTALDELKRPEESLARYEESLAVYRQVLPENHAQIGILLGNMGLTLKNLKRYDEALVKYQEALEVKSASNPESTSVATTLSTIGVLYGLMGQSDQALESHLKALDIRLRLLGEDHVSVAVSHNNIAHV